MQTDSCLPLGVCKLWRSWPEVTDV